MTLISFQHSVKYIFVQLVPYLVLTTIAGCLAAGMNQLWFLTYLILLAVLAWRLISLTCTHYFFTHDLLIVSRGVIFKAVDCRGLWQLKGVEFRQNPLLQWLNVTHIEWGLEGPPAHRIRIVGIDNQTMLKVLTELNAGIELNTEIWRRHFQKASA